MSADQSSREGIKLEQLLDKVIRPTAHSGEALKEDGVTGRLISPSNVASFSKICALVAAQQRALQRRGQAAGGGNTGQRQLVLPPVIARWQPQFGGWGSRKRRVFQARRLFAASICVRARGRDTDPAPNVGNGRAGALCVTGTLVEAAGASNAAAIMPADSAAATAGLGYAALVVLLVVTEPRATYYG